LALSKKALLERAKKIRLLLMDVDGVLTDGKLYYLPGPDGSTHEMKGFDSQDGITLWLLRDYGIQSGIISGRESSGVSARAHILGIAHVHQNHKVKLPVFEKILAETGLRAEQAAFVGDDITDIPVLKRCGLGVAVANARPEAKRAAHWVTRARGGAGGVREVCELLLKSQGHWDKVLERFS
jgi:3-deoxy-D-manno-octulosonate 8-phosphate phosphatase (KDO 8-P phosphatase)